MSEIPARGASQPDPDAPAAAQPSDPAAPAGATSGTGPETAPEPHRRGRGRQDNPLGRTRTSQTWVGIIVFAIILVLLLIFILQNTQEVQISYLGANGHLPLAVAMLLSAVAGIVLAAIAGTMRILQLRRRVKKVRAR